MLIGSVARGYWTEYEAILVTIRAECPRSFAGVRFIPGRLLTLASGGAYFPGGAPGTLADALSDAGWSVEFLTADYLYIATHQESGPVIGHIEADLCCCFEGELER